MSGRQLENYYNRFDPSKGYEEIMIRDGYAGQGAEINEIQSGFAHRVKNIADALFRDGDIVRDARISVNPDSGETQCESGAIYLSGAVRGVAPATLKVPVLGIVTVGVYLQERIITELEDPTLYNPAVGSSAEGEPGAARLQVTTSWGWQSGKGGDGQTGEFFPVYTVDDGNLRAKEAPPNLDAVTQALARYDRDSAGGTYVVSGLNVLRAADTEDGRQVYTIAEGRARVNGFPVDLPTSRRMAYGAAPDLVSVDSEPHTANTSEGQRINLDRTPVAEILNIRITKQTSAQITHGSFSGAADPLPDGSVLEIMSVIQGSVTYTQGTDYKLTAGKVDWSLSGIEPATGSLYNVVYRHIKAVPPDARDDTGVTVSDAVPGTLIQVSYTAKLPRIDCLALNEQGEFVWFQGIPADYNPRAPEVPSSMLAIARVHQTWTAERSVINNGVRVVPMDDIAAINSRIDWLTENMAQQRLTADINLREASAKKGIFVDPFYSDEMRDQGIEQQAAVVDGELTLPVSSVDVRLLGPEGKPCFLTHTLAVALEQPMRTGSMRVNPYSAFEPIPAEVLLNPAIDRWTETQTQWASAITKRFTTGAGGAKRTTTTTTTQQLGSENRDLEYLRQIAVEYAIKGFGPQEEITLFTFDGLPVTPSVRKADADGHITGSFTIPEKVPAGSKSVEIVGSGGSRGTAVFVGQGTLNIRTLQQVTSITTQRYDPLAQTFSLPASMPLAGVDLWFTARGTSTVVVQIRETSVGLPTQIVLAATRLAPADLQLDGLPTRALFDAPVTLQAGAEYAVVIMCDDAETACSIAEVGKWDQTMGQWVTAQPYQVGVLLSSSNASTWTPHQDRDLTFRLLRAVYDPKPITVELGTASVEKATDLMLMALAEQPSAAARIEYSLKLPENATLLVAEGQPVRLPEPLSGNVVVSARISGTTQVSPVLYPGVQLVSGAAYIEADYVSRAVLGGAGSRVRIILDAAVPAGAGVQVAHADGAATDWTAAPFITSRPVDEGFQEIIYEGESDADMIRIRLRLTGTSAARPRIRNLRMLVM